MPTNTMAAQERAAFLNMRDCCLRLFRPANDDARQLVEGLAAVEWRLRRLQSDFHRAGQAPNPEHHARRTAHLRQIRQTALEILRGLRDTKPPEPFLRTWSGDYYHSHP